MARKKMRMWLESKEKEKLRRYVRGIEGEEERRK